MTIMNSPTFSAPALPAITIGMPVFNGEASVRQAIESMLNQTFGDFELIVSDNASTDRTQQICRDCAEADPRVRYIRQPINLGAEGNFRFVFRQARSEYFMWAAADDLRSAGFLETNLAFLREHPDYSGSTCPVRFIGGDFDEIKMGDKSLASDDPHQRLTDFFRTWHANGRYYSLFRRADIEDWKFLNDMSFLASDWTLVLHMATKGKLNRLSSGWVELGRDGFSSKVDLFSYYRKNWVDWLFPFNRLTIYTLRQVWPCSRLTAGSLLGTLLGLNASAFRAQFVARRTRSRPPIRSQPE